MTEHRNVYSALAAAQSEMDAAVKGSVNPAFKSRYADLADVVQACRAALNRNGLAFFHQMVSRDGQLAMRTVLAHGASDTLIECDVPLIVAKQDMQAMKSATTYAKRIGLESVTGIAPEDDDGHATTAQPPRREEPKREQRRENPAAAGVRDAWTAGVLDSLPADASPRDRAQAFADAIIADFDVKTVETLAKRWDRHANLLQRLESEYPNIWSEVVDAYEVRLNELSDEQGAAA